MTEPAVVQAITQMGREFLQHLGEQQTALGQLTTASQNAQTAQSRTDPRNERITLTNPLTSTQDCRS